MVSFSFNISPRPQVTGLLMRSQQYWHLRRVPISTSACSNLSSQRERKQKISSFVVHCSFPFFKLTCLLWVLMQNIPADSWDQKSPSFSKEPTSAEAGLHQAVRSKCWKVVSQQSCSEVINYIHMQILVYKYTHKHTLCLKSGEENKASYLIQGCDCN